MPSRSGDPSAVGTRVHVGERVGPASLANRRLDDRLDVEPIEERSEARFAVDQRPRRCAERCRAVVCRTQRLQVAVESRYHRLGVGRQGPAPEHSDDGRVERRPVTRHRDDDPASGGTESGREPRKWSGVGDRVGRNACRQRGAIEVCDDAATLCRTTVHHELGDGGRERVEDSPQQRPAGDDRERLVGRSESPRAATSHDDARCGGLHGQSSPSARPDADVSARSAVETSRTAHCL